MNVLINENLYDREFVENHCTGFEDLKTTVMNYPPQKRPKYPECPRKR
jgi:formate dehydrogenase major subunit